MKKILLIILLSVLVLLVGCKKSTIIQGLNSIKDEDQLRELLKPRQGFFNYYEKSQVDSNASGAESYTKTNVQIEGIDEGDIVKTDGKRVYAIKDKNLRVIDVLANGDMKLLLNECFEQNDKKNDYIYLSDLYLTDKYLIVIAQQYIYRIIYDNVTSCSNSNATAIYIYNLDDLTRVNEYMISGYLNSSRLIDNNLYLISMHHPYYQDTEVRPWIIENDELDIVDYKDIKYLNNSNYNSFTIITTITLDDEIKYDRDVFLGSGYWENIYVNEMGIVLTTNIYSYGLFGTYSSHGLIVSYLFDEDNGVIFGGSGSYEGVVLDQFAIDEYNSYLRIATSEGWGDKVKNRLYIFQRVVNNNKYVLEKVSLLDKGLGKPGETIKSVRFNKDIATVVTYLNTDPLYTIDLSNPTNPVILGELMITGYSTYQHPWDDGIILGIGYEAEGRTILGLKLALYDIRNVDNPQEINKPLILSNEDGYKYSEALFNHKAIMIDKVNNQFGFSMSYYSNGENYNQYIIFGVDETKETPITINYQIAHWDYKDESDFSKFSGFIIDRGLRINDYLYIISGELITSHRLDNGVKVSEIFFSKVEK